MYSIKDNVENCIEIKKSKFITKLYKINISNDIEKYLKMVSIEYKNPTHICYAYRLNGNEKCNDNGEPSGTAGIPILNVLKKNDLNNVLAIVIRYFGGIKLGAGGLVRAYSNSITSALDLTKKIELIEANLIEIEFSHDKLKLVNYILNNIKIIEKLYENNIIYKIYLKNDELNILNEIKKISINIIIKEKILIEKN